jgi:TonB family protein
MIAIVLKATIVLAAAGCGAALLRGRSAALRHVIWTASLAAVLALPLSTLLTPSWTAIAVMPEAATTTVVVTSTTQTLPAPPIPWLPIVYAAGAALAAARFLAGTLRASWLVRRGTPSALGAEFGLRVVTSPRAPMPLAWGIFRPSILLPTAALEWPVGRLRAVLLHESLHHRRRDLLTQAIAQVACCLYWFHPLAWIALAQQRRERERACDDAVLRQGVTPHEYASSLVEVVRAMASTRREWSDAPAMADSSTLETRVRAVLDRGIDRRPVTGRSACAIALAAAAVLASLSVVSLRAQTTGGTLVGIVQDPSGARVPNCQLTARNLSGTNQEVGTANAAGEYRLVGIPAGRYALEFATPGFALRKLEADVVNGAVTRLDANLEIGQIAERVKVSARRLTPAAAPQAARTPERIRIGGNVTPVRLLQQTRPEYPAELQQAGIEGVVRLRAIISKEGTVLNPQVINSVDPRLAKAALDSVSQWRYQPSLLNGQPVETVTNIDVAFELAPQ